MKSFRLFGALIVLIGIVLAALPASAVVVLTTMPSPGGFTLLQTPAEQLAVLVDVPAGNPYQLNSFQTDSFSGTLGYTAQMDLYEASGTTRGTFVASLGSASAPGSTTGIITFTPGTPITLNAGQRYWFELYPSAGEVGWTLAGPASGIFGAAGARVTIDGGAAWFAHANLAYTLDATELPPPTASFTFTPTYLSVAFTDTSSNSPTSWAWNFGDGSPLSTAQNPTHTYAGNGTYNVCLVATNGIGSSLPACQNVTVAAAAPPVASFTFGATNLTATFADTSSNAPTSWAWDFGDGNISAAQNPTHTYAANGTYNVCLIATNTDGSSAPSCQSVTVAAGVVIVPVAPTPTPAPPIYPLNTWNATAPESRAYGWGMPDHVLGYVLMWHGAWTRIAGTIPDELVNRGVLIAVDVRLSSGGVNFPNDDYQMICLQGEGLLFFMDARTSPRAISQITPTSEENGYTCGWIPAAGTVILTEQ